MQAAQVVPRAVDSPGETAGASKRLALWGALADLLLIAGCAAIAAAMRQDANWDQLQYHYWYPWQLFHGGFTDPDLYGGRFQNPLPQVPFYLLATYLSPVAVQAVLGALAGVALVMTRRIATRVLPFTVGWNLALSLAVAVFAAVGAGFRSEVGTSYSDVLLAGLLLGALLLTLRGHAFLAGLLIGAAAGLKYTTAPFAVAAFVALLIMGAPLLRRVLMWVAGAALGWLVLGAVWAWQLWRTYDSPLFPFWNTVFGSPWYPGANLTDERYGVSGIDQWLRWPWDFAVGQARVLDLPVRDPRWLLLAVAVVALLIGIKRLNRPALATCAFTVVGWFLWLSIFGVIRYAIPAELLASLMVVLALSVYFGPRVTLVITLLLTVGAGLWTQSADSRRVAPASRWYEVAPGAFAAVQSGDAVLVDGQYPSTFALPGQLPSGVPVYVVQKDFTGTPLQDWLRSQLTDAGNVWVLTDKPASQVDGVVGRIDYQKCTKVQTNIVNRWLCPVVL